MTQNPYDILGVPKNASIDEIKSQYRRLALKFHPDKSKSQYSEEDFKEITKAYDILLDPIKRLEYDKQKSEFSQETSSANSSSQESAKQIWLRQLKTMGKELLRILENFAKKLNERPPHTAYRNYQSFEYDDYYEYESPRPRPRRSKQRRTQYNYEEPWEKIWRSDAEFANNIFGFDKPRKKGQRYNDYGFNTEDVFDL